jgi:hypothetical protein
MRTPVDGYLVLGSHSEDHDCEIYVGDRFVGVGAAKIAWSEILGWHGHEPLGIVLPKDASWPPRPTEVGGNQRSSEPAPPAVPAGPLSVGEATAERLAGNGATIVHFAGGSPIRSAYSCRHCFAHKEMLIMRGDRTLDHVFCLDAGFTDILGRTYRVLVPIRVRSPDPKHAGMFTSSNSYCTRIERDGNKVVAWGHASYPRNGWIHRYSHAWGFQSVDPPDEFADEIRARGLWKPENED